MKSEDIVKLPLNEILQSLGYEVDRSKSSRRAIVMKNDCGDKVIVNRASSGDYLYFNPNDDKDRGNLFSFCKNRQLDYKVVISNFSNNVEQVIHSLKPQNTIQEKREREEKIQLFEGFENLKEDNEVLKKRCLSFAELNFKDLKQDKQGNLCVKLWETKKIEDGRELIFPCGYSAKLRRALTHRDGERLKKPIKNLIYGDKGVEILIGNFNSFKEVKNIIISESVIDSLSYKEIAGIKSEECIVIGTGGNLKENEWNVIKNLAEKFNNSNFTLAFDRDEEGRKFCEKVGLMLSEIIPNEKIKIAIPQLKDFNDDLQIIKTFNLDKSDQEIEKKVKAEIIRRENKIKSSFLSDFEKSKLITKCEELKKKVVGFKEQEANNSKKKAISR